MPGAPGVSAGRQSAEQRATLVGPGPPDLGSRGMVASPLRPQDGAMILFSLVIVPLLRYLTIRMRVVLGLPLLVMGLAMIFGSGSLAALFVPGAVIAAIGMILVVSAVLRKPRPRVQTELEGVRS